MTRCGQESIRALILIRCPPNSGIQAFPWNAATEQLNERIKNYAESALNRAADADKQAGVACETVQVKHAQHFAISSSWHRTGAADYPQLCSAA
jgi:hypothetical protein